jgi:hypothetical protein
MKCPYGNHQMREFDRQDSIGADYNGSAIEIVYLCDHCEKAVVMRLEYEGMYDEDDNPIEEA